MKSYFSMPAVQLILAMSVVFACPSGRCEEVGEEKPGQVEKLTVKLTPSYYQSSDGNNATDLNLRMNTGAHALWLGFYDERSGQRQARTGYEYTQVSDIGQVVWSLQAASRGFLGGSITAQTAGTVFAIAGIGRTNLRNYYNLNFDPNDAVTFGVGARFIKNTDFSVFQIADDRLHTMQRVTHLYVHHNFSANKRISLDSAFKRGLDSENVFIHARAVTLTYAVGDYFFRIAHDQNANFGVADQNRFSAGIVF